MHSPLATFVVLTTLQALAAPLEAQMGLASPPRSVQLMATKRASVGVALPGGTAAPMPAGLTEGATDFAPLPIVTTWNVDPSRTATLRLAAFFDVPDRALAGTDAAIPASRVLGRVPSGGPKSFVPFTGPAVVSGSGIVGVTGGTLVLFVQPISSANAVGSRRDELQVRVDLSGAPDLRPGGCSGTLNLVATTQ
jgi:hypothetical protein